MKKNRTRGAGSYLKLTLGLLGSMAVGAVIGMLSVSGESAVGEFFSGSLNAVKTHAIGILWILGGVSLIFWVGSAWKIKKLGERLRREEEEENLDLLEYRLERCSSVVLVLQNFLLASALLVLAALCTQEFFMELGSAKVFQILGLFLAECVIFSFWQISFVKQVQKINPEKKGDPADWNFHKKWLASCDEGEKEIIYQASYHVFQMMNVLFPMGTVFALVCQITWKTGIFAVLLCCVFWVIVTIGYSVNILQLYKKKLNC